jgi:superfamily II DNA or RNA helicase
MLSKGDFELFYSSGEREPMEFFLDGFLLGTELDLALGYFSTSGFNALALGLAPFIARGGRIRIIANDALYPLDKGAILKGLTANGTPSILALLAKPSDWYPVLSRRDQHFFDCIAYLVSQRRLQFKVVRPREPASGIVHQKFGIFRDDCGNEVAFNGSANFSAAAFTQNVEALSCYRSWIGNDTEDRGVAYFVGQFDRIWSGSNLSVEEIDLGKVTEVDGNRGVPMPLAELLELESQVCAETLEEVERRGQGDSPLASKMRALTELLQVGGSLPTPHLPKGVALRQYQADALRAWEERGHCGLFEMATGTGKSLTALNCALQIRRDEGAVHILVLVPTQSLATQWESLLLHDAEFLHTVVASGDNPDWWSQGNRLLNYDRVAQQDWVIIATYATFATSKFQSLMNRMSESALLIADEVHNFGTRRLVQLHPHRLTRRIGLSATPARYFDDEGTEAIVGFFGAQNGPAYSFDMARAIEEGFLCRYRYHPYVVPLLDEELTAYREISRKLGAFFDEKTGKLRSDAVVVGLLLKRKRIIHKATGKLGCLREILTVLTTGEQRLSHTLVYVPEGDYTGGAEDGRKLIDAFSEVITREFRLTQHQFIGATKDRPEILRQFETGEIGVLTSMKCLDEGIDVPKTSTAVFCASTGNSRQFVQRRGRVLRRAPGKERAEVFDMVVIPAPGQWMDDRQMRVERSLLQSELRRVHEFANLAENRYEALGILDPVCRQYDIEVYGAGQG